MHNNISKRSFGSSLTLSQRAAIKGGFLILVFFAIIRPLSLMGGEKIAVAGIGILEIVGVGISYLLLLPFVAGLRRFQFDRMAFLIFLYCMYSIESICWGSDIRNIAQTVLPFLMFFSVRMFVTESNQVNTLLITLVLGFLVPITLSTYNILLGRSIEYVEWWNKLPRHTGGFSGSHTLAYAMLFFSFLYCILNHAYRFKNSIQRFVLGFFLILSVYGLYQSHTRTALIGFVIFWFIYLFGNKRKLFYGAIILSILSGIIFHNQIYRLIFKKEQIDLNTATSGRISLWAGNIQEFIDSNLLQQLFGRGIGHEHRIAFHNDYIALLMSLGIIGLILYLILLFCLLWDIYLCKDKGTKYLFGAVLISVVVMNFGSNAVVFRVELSQYFWLIMGIFYTISGIKNDGFDIKTNN